MNAGDETGRKYRVLLVEDHASMRRAVRGLIERHPGFEVCGEAADATEAELLVVESGPDIAVIDISLPMTNGLEVTRRLREMRPALPILILSMHKEDIYAEHALRAGAHGYLMKQEAAEQILPALECISRGEFYASDRMMAARMHDALTARIRPEPDA